MFLVLIGEEAAFLRLHLRFTRKPRALLRLILAYPRKEVHILSLDMGYLRPWWRNIWGFRSGSRRRMWLAGLGYAYLAAVSIIFAVDQDWVDAGAALFLLGIAFVLSFVPEQENRPWWRYLPGFRSGRRYRMWFAGFFYFSMVLGIPLSFGSGDMSGGITALGTLVAAYVGGRITPLKPIAERDWKDNIRGIARNWRRMTRALARGEPIVEQVSEQAESARHYPITEAAKLREKLTMVRVLREGAAPSHSIGVRLRLNERCIAVLRGIVLVEPREGLEIRVATPPRFQFHLLRFITYTPGSSRERIEQEPERLTPVDVGTVTLTDTRIVFQGKHNTREWVFDSFLGFAHHPEGPFTTIHVANREKISSLSYPSEEVEEVRFRLDLAAAAQREEEVARMEERLVVALKSIEERQPT